MQAESDRRFTRAITLGCIVFLIVNYGPGLRAWFQQDDFAWLALWQRIGVDMDLKSALFQPFAQGTVRVFSERVYFLAFRWLFGLNAFPYHLLAFATQTANIAMLVWLVRRLSGSVWIGATAALIWTAHSAIAWPLVWASAYNQILCAFVFLAVICAFALEREIVAAGIFLLGFGVLELNVMLPLVALVFTLSFAPSRWRWPCALLIPSAAFALLHMYLVPKSSTGVYSLAINRRLFQTAWSYWSMTLWPQDAALIGPRFLAMKTAAVLVLTLLVIGGFAWGFLRSEKLILFGLGWFVLTLAPYLLLPDHIQNYYLTVPLIGFAMALSAAIAAVSREWSSARYAMVPVLALLLGTSALAAHRYSWKAAQDSLEAKRLVLGAREVARNNPGKTIFLAGITDDQFWNSFYGHPFRLVNLNDVYLAPDNVDKLVPFPEICDFHDYSRPLPVAIRLLEQGQAVVYDAGPEFREVTEAHLALLRKSTGSGEAPKDLQVADPAFAYLLKSGWYATEPGYRWTSKSAAAVLGNPAPGEHLEVRGFCAPEEVRTAPIRLTVLGNDVPLSTLTLDKCTAPIRVLEALTSVPRRPQFEVRIEVDHTVRVGADLRDLGVAIESIRIVP
jgi:hypothetical protein